MSSWSRTHRLTPGHWYFWSSILPAIAPRPVQVYAARKTGDDQERLYVVGHWHTHAGQNVCEKTVEELGGWWWGPGFPPPPPGDPRSASSQAATARAIESLNPEPEAQPEPEEPLYVG